MKYHLILIPNLAEKLIFQIIYLQTFTKNLGSNLIRVAKLLSNIGMKLSNSQETFQQLSLGGALVFERFLKLGKLQCKSYFNKN